MGGAEQSRSEAGAAAEFRLSAFVFQCSGANGRWLALRGPVLLDADLVVECAAGLLDPMHGCRKVSVWVGDERVLPPTNRRSVLRRRWPADPAEPSRSIASR